MDIPYARMLRQYGRCLILFLLCVLPLTAGLEQVFFNSTSSILLPSSTLSLRPHLAFSFRTCSGSSSDSSTEGSSMTLLEQRGASGNVLGFRLERLPSTSGERLAMYWSLAPDLATAQGVSSTQQQFVRLDATPSLANNNWYTVDTTFDLGQIHLSIERGATTLERILVSNSTLRRYLWDLDMTGGEGIRVGQGFVGCFLGGPGLNLRAADAQETDVLWGQCPLANPDAYQQCAPALQNPCYAYPCQNGGTCLVTGSRYSCQCRIPYSGTHCEEDLGSTRAVCELNPCQNGGTCKPQETGTRKYSCECPSGYTGATCAENIDECTVADGGVAEDGPCKNGAVCMDSPGSYKCQCQPGYRPPDCEQVLQACISNPCQFGGTCVDEINRADGYTCACVAGRSGENCQLDIDDCAGVMCDQVPGTQCVDGLNEYFCQCRPGFTDPSGATSGNSASCININECASTPCRNGATCVDGENQYTCNCLLGYAGQNCENDINECNPNPCLNGATCVNGINEHRCECALGYSGPTCSTNVDDCLSSPCRNGGVCNDGIAEYSCGCMVGFTGQFCELAVNECSSAPCQNGGTCNDGTGEYTCNCRLGFSGPNCAVNNDECVSAPCLNGATCVDGENMYKCNCTDAFMGVNCQSEYNACAMAPCQNGGTCTTNAPAHIYTCTCPNGFTGTDCAVNIDDCAAGHDCPDYKVCMDGIGEYTCECPAGRAGDLCDEDIDECLSNPCMNGGTCKNKVGGGFECACLGKMVNLTQYTGDPASFYRVGYQGVRCEENINECAYMPSICLNEGKCEDYRSGGDFYKCFCPSGGEYYTGKNCELKKDYCDIVSVSDPPACHNGATCQDIQDNYLCLCAPGFTGVRCKVNIDDCESTPCMQGGTCQDGINSFTCICPPGLTGPMCETNIDECTSGPCLNDGRCVDQINGYQCDCTETGFMGDHCQTNINDCEPNPCVNGGNCTDGIKDFACACYTGYAGKRCEVDVDECVSNPCQNEAACVQRSKPDRPGFSYDTAAGYDCVCQPGFEGVSCEINIDECLSSPCLNSGTCQDGINGYTCACVPGYRGNRCEEDINECVDWAPCQNGARCIDAINNYWCDCLGEIGGKQYGGKNCSIELTGCRVNDCQNGATCLPSVTEGQNGAPDVHTFTCKCAPGFKADKCEVATTSSFPGTTWGSYDSIALVELSLRFRTTLLEGALLINKQVEGGVKEFVLSIAEAGRGVKAELRKDGAVLASALVKVEQDGVTLTDGTWQQVSILFAGDSPSLFLNHSACPDQRCNASLSTLAITQLTGTTFFGGANALVGHKAYIGCMQDVTLNSINILTPTDLGTVAGCPRVAQCFAETCTGDQGTCVDEWYKYTCKCNRPYYGTNCQYNFVAATFGFENAESAASFNVPALAVEKMRRTNDVSMFFRTREPDGLLFYIGGDRSGAAYEQTFLAAMLESGDIVVKLILSNAGLQTFTFPGPFNDGEQHLLVVFRNLNSLAIEVDNKHQNHAFVASFSLDPSHVYIGGIPSENTRRKKRQAADLLIDAPAFKGTLQDVRHNDYVLNFFAPNATASQDGFQAYQIPTLTNVEEGEKSDDVCTMITPCVNGATCSNVFFNDYKCDCMEGYKGKNCSTLDFCMYTQCPGNSTCNDLLDGFECIAPATFDGQTSMVKYQQNLSDTTSLPKSLSFSFRTRETDAVLLSVFYNGGQNSLVTYIQESMLIGAFRQGAETKIVLAEKYVNDGEWHKVVLEFDATGPSLSLNLDGNSSSIAIGVVSPNVDIFGPTASVYIGGVPAEETAVLRTYFKGCVEEARVGNVLLPFFAPSEIVNNTAMNQYLADQTSVATLTAAGECRGDPVCDAHDCVNGATCLDVWNKFECLCVPGFEGEKCEINIDECPGNLCENGATCVDGINQYTCDCVPGYTGEMCQTDIDECASTPCQYNGTCTDLVNAFECNCTENYGGDECEYDLRENCANDPCQNNATCVNVTTKYEGILTFNCTCVPGFEGTYCEKEIDYCEGHPCQNNATCESRREILNYTCTCAPGYTGSVCEVDIDECASSPCQNDATCVDKVNGYECSCAEGWEGVLCEENINECNTTINGTTPCENGECIDKAPGYECNCTQGWEGFRCDEDIDECFELAEACYNGGECTNEPGSFSCNCTLGYEGERCQNANCSADQCQNEATCSVSDTDTEGVEEWKCQCVEFYEGVQCEIVGGCVAQPCVRGDCSNVNGTDYKCDCPEGWEGKNCSEDIDECATEPCLNGATCLNFDGGFNCTCVLGYEGKFCGIEIDYCERDMPCKNGGVCSPVTGSFKCDCTGTGYNGTTCEENVDECAAEINPCLNGGSCVDTIGSFNCTCVPGFVGNVCHSYDLCSGADNTTYCANNGTCSSEVNDSGRNITTTCSCHSEWIGETCAEPNPAIAAPVTDNNNMIIIIVASVVATCVIVAAIVFIVWLRSTIAKRANQGTYSPSRQEMSGARVEMANGLKIPPPERLI